jgi:hypothetical protein
LRLLTTRRDRASVDGNGCLSVRGMPPNLIKDLFESRTTPELGWPQGKPLPDLDQFVDRSIVNEVLKEMGRKPGGK